MRLESTARFLRDYERLPENVQVRLDQTLERLLANPRHPSLQFKKMQGYPDRWEGRVSRSYRITFSISGSISGDVYRLRRGGPHDILESP